MALRARVTDGVDGTMVNLVDLENVITTNIVLVLGIFISES